MFGAGYFGQPYLGQGYAGAVSGPASLPAGVQSVDLPPKARARARDYSYLNQTPILVGQDSMVVGQSLADTELPPRAYPRVHDYTWLQSLPIHAYQVVLPPGGSTQATERPPRGWPRARDYTFLDFTKPHLIGQDVLYGAPGQVPTYDWQLPTPARKRMRDYTATDRFRLAEFVAAAQGGFHTLTDRALFEHTLSEE